MTFQTVKAALELTLATQGAGIFRVIGHQSQSVSDDRIANLPLVEVYYDGGAFPKSAGASIGSKSHDAIFRVSLTVATGSKTNLAVLENPAASAGHVAAALAASKAATRVADEAFDELASQLWNIINLPANHSLGLAKGTISNLWTESVKKSSPVERGQWVVLSGNIDVSLRCKEVPASVSPVAGASIKTTLSPTTDPTADPETIGFDPDVTPDPKFNTAPEGVEV